MTLNHKVNMCTVTLHVAAEAKKSSKVTAQYECISNMFPLSACRHFKPMKCAGGMLCHTECDHFNNGCTCKKARSEAKIRAAMALQKWMS